MSGRPRVWVPLLPLVIIAAALFWDGCGSGDEGFPPAAEPGVAPEASTEPAGVVIPLGKGEAEGIAVDPKTGIAAIGTRDPDELFLVSDPLAGDGSKATVRRGELPESPRHARLAAPGGPVITTAERTDDFIEISLPSGKLRTVRVGDYPHDADVAGDRYFVGNEGEDTISVIEGDATTVELPAPEQPGGVAASADQRWIGVIAVAERVLTIYDAETLERTGTVDAGVGPTHIVAGADSRFYVADTQGDAILVFSVGVDGEPRLTDRANVSGAPYGMAIDNPNARLWVTRTDANEVVEMELTELAPKRLATYPTVRQPNTVGVDTRTGLVYVVSRTDGELQVFDPAREGGGEK